MLGVTDAFIDTVAQLVAERMPDSAPPGPEPWIGVEQAAEHLACPKSRVYRLVSMRRIPFCKDGSRTLFRRSELDVWVAEGGARR